MPRDVTADLRRTAVSAGTQSRYATALQYFWAFCQLVNVVLGIFPEESALDEAVTTYIEWLYRENLPKFQSTLILAAVLDLFPRSRLAQTRRVVRAWDRLEPSKSAFPIHALYLIFLIHEILLGGNLGIEAGFEIKLQFSCIMLLLFLGLFRPAEVRTLTRASFTLGPSPQITVRVRGKTEVRANRPATAVTINDPFLHLLLTCLLEVRASDAYLFSLSAQTFTRFCKNVSAFYPMFPRIIPYSFKRGGASDLFRRTGSFDICVDQGRWEHVNTARRYIEAALAEQMIFELSPAWLRRMQQARAHLFEFARSGGMGGRSRLFDDVLSL